MNLASSPILAVGVNDSRVVPDVSSSPMINYAAATTAPHLNNYHMPHSRSKSSAISKYAHQDKATIAHENNFDLQGVHTANLRAKNNKRMPAKSFAITSWTNVSKEGLLEHIINQFKPEILQYICIAHEKSPTTSKSHLHVQIILKRLMNKYGFFLDEYTGVHCNYQITKNDCAWNAYIQKDGDYIEHGTFPSPEDQQNERQSFTPTSTSVDVHNDSTTPVTPQLPPPKRKTVRSQVDERRQGKNDIAATALTFAEQNIPKAMAYVREKLPYEFMQRSENFHKSFNYVHKRARERQQHLKAKEYCWDLSFPNCTPQLHAVVTEWLKENFQNPNRPKCLILVGPTGTGKTSFAKSLPGQFCYFKGRWSLDSWSDQARYLIFDDIPWDKFDDRNFPNKKDLLSANGAVGVTDKYQPTVTINVTMPAIVLLNPGDEGSLTAPPLTEKERHDADYWSKRAFIYQMGPDEYFYKHQASNILDAASSSQIRPPLGYANEFADEQRRWLEARDRRRQLAAATTTATVTDDNMEQPSLMATEGNPHHSDENF